MRAKVIIIITFIVLMLTNICAGGNGKIVFMRSSTWKFSNNYPNTDYLAQLRTYTSICDFDGIPYDVLTYESATNETLSQYSAMIAINPISSSFAGIVQNFTENNGKHALVTYNCNVGLMARYGLTKPIHINEHPAINISSFNGDITYGINNLATWSFVSYVPGENITVNMKDVKGNPIISTAKHGNGTIVFFLNHASSITYNNIKLLQNFVDIATNFTPRVTANTPYAQDLVILLRYDDYFTNYWPFLKMYNLTHECTIASPLSGTTAATLAKAQDADFVPHSYKHIDLSRIAYEGAYSDIQTAKNVYYNFTGHYPYGLICPYNSLNNNVTLALRNLSNNKNEYRWVTWTDSTTPEPMHYYTTDANYANNIWVLGGESIPFSQFKLNKSELVRYKNMKHSIMLIDHPTHHIKDGTLSTMVDHLSLLLNLIRDVEGVYLSNVSSYVRKLDDSRNVYVINDTIVASSNVAPGLTFTSHNLRSNLVIDGQTATIIYRQNKTMLPALSAGNHKYVYSNDYPRITKYTNGSLITDGYYDIPNKIMTFEIHDENEIYKSTNISITGLTSDTEYNVIFGGDLFYTTKTSQNGNLVLYRLKEGIYKIIESDGSNTDQVPPHQNIINYIQYGKD
jgi:spore coat protein U-like protein